MAVANYASTVGQLAQNEMVMSAQDRARHEAMLERLIRAREQRENRLVQGQAMAQRERESGVQQQQFRQQMQANSARDARIGGQFQDQLEEQRHGNQTRAIERGEDMDWRRKVFTMNESIRNAQELLPYADEMADRGLFGSTEDVIKHFPTLSKQADAIAAKSRAIRFSMESEQNWARGAAEAINAPQRFRNMVSAEREAMVPPVRTRWSRLPFTDVAYDDTRTAAARTEYTNPNIKEWQAAEMSAQPTSDRFSKMMEGNPRMSGIVSPNPETGMTEVTRQLPWRASGGTATATNGVAPVRMTPFGPEGSIIYNKTTGQPFRIVNGEPVPVEQTE